MNHFAGLEFTGSDKYIASEALQQDVGFSFKTGRPLLIKGEPGTGKTELAREVARALGIPIFEFHVKSTSTILHAQYIFDDVQRLKDVSMVAALYQAGKTERAEELDARTEDPSNYITKGAMWEAFEHNGPCVLLMDEIDKAGVEFPNDLLRELNEGQFAVTETNEVISAGENMPFIVITSNNERELPDPFLRRCLFHLLQFPSPQMMMAIIERHLPDVPRALAEKATNCFYTLREDHGMPMKKKPSTSELIDWLRILLSDQLDGGSPIEEHTQIRDLLGLSALVKTDSDIGLVEQLNFPAERHVS